MPDPIEDQAKRNAEAYKKAAESYSKAMEAAGKATTKIADKAAKAPAPGSRAATIASGVGPNGLPLEQPATVATPTNPAIPTTPMGGVNLSAVNQPAPAPASAVIPQAVQNYQDTIEAKRAGMLGYDPAAAAAAVPPAVGTYQAQIEAPRVLDRHSMGLPGPIEQAAAQSAAQSAAPTSSAATEAKKASAIDKIIEDMKAELGDEKTGPNFWDIIQAAAAGWNLQTPAYIEKQREKAKQKSELEKLSKTAQFEKALQEEREASESARLERKIQADKELAAMQLGKKPLLPGLSAGTNLGLQYLQGIGKLSKTSPIVAPAKSSGGAY